MIIFYLFFKLFLLFLYCSYQIRIFINRIFTFRISFFGLFCLWLIILAIHTLNFQRRHFLYFVFYFHGSNLINIIIHLRFYHGKFFRIHYGFILRILKKWLIRDFVLFNFFFIIDIFFIFLSISEIIIIIIRIFFLVTSII